MLEEEGDALEGEAEECSWLFTQDLPCLSFVRHYRRKGNKVSPKVRRMLLNRTVESLMREGKSIAARGGIVTRQTAVTHYNVGSEWELESTLEVMVAKGTLDTPAYDDIRSRSIIRSKRCFIILADKSNSLGPTIDYVALAVSILAEAVRNEEYAVLLFDDTVREIKGIRDSSDAGDVLEQILNIECSGATNLHAAFEEVRNRVDSASPGAETICVVVSDAIPTVGPDPTEIASTLPQMEVLYFPNTSSAIGETCIDALEALPRVRVREIKELSDIVDAVQEIISYGSLEGAHG